MLKHIVSTFLLCLLSLFGFSHSEINIDNSTLAFIELQSDMAIQEMHRTGIPASITLAQAIVESFWGRGQLAIQANNYFGIKCNNHWNGETFYQKDDDYKNGKLVPSCFRKYTSIKESYIDHSNFLMGSSRYANLFNLSKTDYKGWARGLKAAGYATDPQYAQKLIEKIEVYKLYKYDWTEQNFNVESGLATNYSSPTTQVKISNPVEIPAAFELPDDYVPNYYGDHTEKTPMQKSKEPKPAISTEAQHAIAPQRPVRHRKRR